MVVRVDISKDLLSRFDSWVDEKRSSLLVPYRSQDPAMPQGVEGDVPQGVICREDFKRGIHELSTKFKYEVASLAQYVAMLALSPFALVGEMVRCCSGSISASTCLKNICTVPKHIIFSIFNAAFCVAEAMEGVVAAASTRIGFLTWHGGERLVRLITGSSNTVLSNHSNIRDIVYHSVGITLLATAALFIPVAPIQMMALPIIIGSIYGTINNQFTVRQCPEYYTMGHYYDGTDLKGHAIKTNNVLIKPIITGCYATTAVTQIAGVILAGVGTLPYTAAILPIPFAGAMIAGVCAISLIAAHIFSNLKRNAIQKNLAEYAKLIGLEWNEASYAKTWDQLAEARNACIEQKRKEFSRDTGALMMLNQQLQKLTQEIESNILTSSLPVKYITGWQANNTRNSIGYLFAGGGTLAIAISTVFLRVFAL